MTITRRLGLAAVVLTAALAAALLLSSGPRSAPAASASARLPATFFGMIPQNLPSPADFNRMRRGGVDSFRFGINWNEVQPNPGTFNWGVPDTIIAGAARKSIAILPVLANSPDWATGSRTNLPVGNGSQITAWKTFLTEVVDRYGPQGQFWAQHGSGSADPVPYRPLRRYQVGNEPNFVFFATPPSVSRYAKLLRISEQAIHRADRTASIILAGLFAQPKGRQNIPAIEFLRRLYRVRGIKSLFDGVALHPYARSFEVLKPQINRLRAVMRSANDQRTGLYITEVGWGSGTDTAFEKGVRGQVKQLQGAFSLLKRKQRVWRIQEVDWYAFDDIEGSCNFCDSVGLFDINGNPKPAWFRYAKIAGGRP